MCVSLLGQMKMVALALLTCSVSYTAIAETPISWPDDAEQQVEYALASAGSQKATLAPNASSALQQRLSSLKGDARIEVELLASHPSALKRYLQREGIDYERVTPAGEAWLVQLTRRQANRLLRQSFVRYIDLPVPLWHPNVSRDDRVAQDHPGVLATKVQRLHDAGITGAGVRVGVIDMGFARLPEALSRTGMKPPIAVRNFSQDPGFGRDQVHGTGVAEIIASMAPDAELYLAQFDGNSARAVDAAQWLVAQDVDIINASWGGHGDRKDGRAPLDRFVDYLTDESGVLWISAAGNEARRHWLGSTVDRNRNGLVDVPVTRWMGWPFRLPNPVMLVRW